MQEPWPEVIIHTPAIPLDGFLKWCGAARTGGEAKVMVQAGRVLVNDQTETRRSRLLRPGDRVEVPGKGRWRVASPPQPCR